MIAWPGLCEPGTAMAFDPSRLISSSYVLEGAPFYDRASLKSLADQGLTLVQIHPTGFALAALNACSVEAAAHAASGDRQRAYATLAATEALEDHIMSLVPFESTEGPWAASVLAALSYNMLATADAVDSSGQADLLEMIAATIREVQETRESVKRSQSMGAETNHHRNQLRLRFCDLVEKDLLLILSAARELQSANGHPTSYGDSDYTPDSRLDELRSLVQPFLSDLALSRGLIGSSKAYPREWEGRVQRAIELKRRGRFLESAEIYVQLSRASGVAYTGIIMALYKTVASAGNLTGARSLLINGQIFYAQSPYTRAVNAGIPSAILDHKHHLAPYLASA